MAAKVLVLGSVPALCVAFFCFIAFQAERRQDWSGPRAGAYGMNDLAADTRQTVAVVHYLLESDLPLSAPTQPLLTQSNYSSLLTTNKAHPI